MKKILFLLMTLYTLTFTSCSDIYAQSVTVSDDCIYYEYVYNGCPARIYNHNIYYYSIVNGYYTWQIVPRKCYSNVLHLYEPRVFHHRPHVPVREFHPRPYIAPKRPHRSSTRTTYHRHSHRQIHGKSRPNTQHRSSGRR